VHQSSSNFFRTTVVVDHLLYQFLVTQSVAQILPIKV